MRTVLMTLGLALSVAASAAACGSQGEREPFGEDSPDGAVGSSGTSGTGSSGETINSGDSGTPITSEPGKTTLRGVTYAPNGTLPLAGVLVYETDVVPAPIPEHVYCDSCRVLPEGTFTVSGPDGSFELKGHAGARYLVTEKGQFRRVRRIEVGPDGTEQTVDATTTTLPGRTAAGSNGEGDTIPRIALMDELSGDKDAIHLVLRALGIQEWENFQSDRSKVTAENLQNFHIALFPCDDRAQNAPKSAQIQAVRGFVQAGGKAYASDWSHAYVDEAFKEFFKYPNRVWGADVGAQSPTGRFDDDGLKAWLSAVSPGEDPNATQLHGVWSTYTGMKDATVPDATGANHTVSPYKFASITDNSGLYSSREAATSMEFGCGRALLSTFHVHGGTGNLLMQEKALLYMLLDVSTCIGEPGRGGPVVN